jgi:uncharacterized membrane protein
VSVAEHRDQTLRAFSLAPASLLAPFGDLSIVWASLLGCALFDERLDTRTVIGALLIAAAGIYLYRDAGARS